VISEQCHSHSLPSSVRACRLSWHRCCAVEAAQNSAMHLCNAQSILIQAFHTLLKGDTGVCMYRGTSHSDERVVHSIPNTCSSTGDNRTWPAEHRKRKFNTINVYHSRRTRGLGLALLGCSSRPLFCHDLVVIVVELVNFLLPGPVIHLQLMPTMNVKHSKHPSLLSWTAGLLLPAASIIPCSSQRTRDLPQSL
jgi:hypothetical protein